MLFRSRFVYAGATVNLSSLERRQVGPGEITSLSLQEAIADGHAEQIAKNWQGNQAWLEGRLEFNCRVHQFAKLLPSMSGVQVSLANAHLRNRDA